ncbi:unnamed protein product [Sphagnum troendelagicum]
MRDHYKRRDRHTIRTTSIKMDPYRDLSLKLSNICLTHIVDDNVFDSGIKSANFIQMIDESERIKPSAFVNSVLSSPTFSCIKCVESKKDSVSTATIKKAGSLILYCGTHIKANNNKSNSFETFMRSRDLTVSKSRSGSADVYYQSLPMKRYGSKTSRSINHANQTVHLCKWTDNKEVKLQNKNDFYVFGYDSSTDQKENKEFGIIGIAKFDKAAKDGKKKLSFYSGDYESGKAKKVSSLYRIPGDSQFSIEKSIKADQDRIDFFSTMRRNMIKDLKDLKLLS